MVRNLPAHAAENPRDAGSIPGSGRSPRVGNGNPLRYSCLEKPREPSGLQSMRSQRVGNNCTHTYTEYLPKNRLITLSMFLKIAKRLINKIYFFLIYISEIF